MTSLRLISARALALTSSRRFVQSTVHNFSTSCTYQLRTSELKPDQLTWFKADSARLWSDIHSTAKWGGANRWGDQSEETGLSRLTLDDNDKKARDWFCETVKSLSCEVYVDEVGNTFAIRPGLKNDIPATFVGSHLDSQPMGGRYDGILGVCAGIEMLRVLQDNHIETEGPVGVINWTNEEGARFPISMMGSAVWAGQRTLESTYALKDVTTSDSNPKTVLEELERIGYKGPLKSHWDQGVKIGAHFELHIEQGPYLVNNNQKIGVVEGVQAYKWFEVVVQGRSAHTGATGYEYRADALHWASRVIWELRAIAESMDGLASVGIIKSQPQSVNTVPDRVMFSLDVRHGNNEKLRQLVAKISQLIEDVDSHSAAKSVPVTISMKETFSCDATVFDHEAVKCVEDGALALFQTPEVESPMTRRLNSGAGHDSVNTQVRCPTAMVFVPCKDGISHNPREWCSQEDCANGASVILQAVIRYDRLRHSKGHFDE